MGGEGEFYGALVGAQRVREPARMSPAARGASSTRLRWLSGRMGRRARWRSDNFGARATLLSALTSPRDAHGALERAAAHARLHGQLHVSALANRLAAESLLGRSSARGDGHVERRVDRSLATAYWQRMLTDFDVWGAHGLTRLLRQERAFEPPSEHDPQARLETTPAAPRGPATQTPAPDDDTQTRALMARQITSDLRAPLNELLGLAHEALSDPQDAPRDASATLGEIVKRGERLTALLRLSQRAAEAYAKPDQESWVTLSTLAQDAQATWSKLHDAPSRSRFVTEPHAAGARVRVDRFAMRDLIEALMAHLASSTETLTVRFELALDASSSQATHRLDVTISTARRVEQTLPSLVRLHAMLGGWSLGTHSDARRSTYSLGRAVSALTPQG